MHKSAKILAFIGARGGSKGLKDKNIIDLAGKPLICWTIEAALNSKYVDRTIVSTDSEKIAQVARGCGADVPFLRPPELAQDHSLIEDALRHGLDWLSEKENDRFDYILSLHPTSPLRRTEHINQAIEYYFANRKTPEDTLVSVVKAPDKVGWLMQPNASGYIQFCFGLEGQSLRRQNLPKYYLPNGVIFFAPVSVIKKNCFYTPHTLPFVMDESVSIDIDHQEDLEKAREVLELMSARGKYGS